ncbi:BREX-3 system P-loop-containing protein BrxF [uncultured Veillonella sp.]|uniref:BREX-3 system P-loop-containing protein BrxF n=1 Tax=uncultured Veillonella sp. TaxID=159268 RepID=UPI002588F61E|nr:BREX-3 system P-loop-containing protein BrxF [uncultured Veillonella sp.]
MITAQDIKARWEELQEQGERILFVVGGPGSGKSRLIRELAEQDGWKYMEAKDLLEEEFLEVAHELRPQRAYDELSTSLKAYDAKVALIDGVNVLFAPILNLTPVDLLKEISKEYPIIVGWRGRFDGTKLHLEHNNNPEYFSFEVENPQRIIVVE